MTKSLKKVEKKEDIAELFVEFSQYLHQYLRAHEPSAISPLHIRTLMCIAERQGQNMKNIAEEMKVTPAAVTLIIDKLADDKEIKRIADLNDHRITRLALTPKGVASLKAGKEIFRKHIAEIVSVLSVTEQKEFAVILKKLINKN